MSTFSSGSISRNILFLIIVAVLPGAILVGWGGIEHRNEAVTQAKKEIFNLSNSLVSSQQNLLNSTRALLQALSFSEYIVNLDVERANRILAEIVTKEPFYQNFSLTDPEGNVLASARPMNADYLGDRQHVVEALRTRKLAVGEFIVSRLTKPLPGLPFCQPVFDAEKNIVGLLTGVVNLEYLQTGFEIAGLPNDSFVAVTDRQGVFLYKYPDAPESRLGSHISSEAWAAVASATTDGLFSATDYKGEARIFACRPIVTAVRPKPTFYLWASVPEQAVLSPANASLKRNMLYVLSFFMLSLIVAWFYGQKTIKTPILQLTDLAEKFALGDLDARASTRNAPEEIANLTRAFHNMALSVSSERQTLAEEKELMTVTLKSIGDGVITTNVDGHVVLINEVASELTGWSQEDAAGKPLSEVFNIIDEANRLLCKSPVERVLETGHAVSLVNHTILISRQGRETNIAHCGAPIKSSAGKIIGVVLVIRDVSKEQIIERELRKVGKLEAIGFSLAELLMILTTF